jgi:hypothetical protein
MGLRAGLDMAMKRSCVTFHNVLVFYGEELLLPTQASSFLTIPCHLFTIAYLIYSQLPSASEGYPLYSQSPASLFLWKEFPVPIS